MQTWQKVAEGEGCAPLLPSFDNRSTEGFEPFRKLAESAVTSPCSQGPNHSVTVRVSVQVAPTAWHFPSRYRLRFPCVACSL